MNAQTIDHNTPVVILAGGQGTRIRDVSSVLPKPMLDVGGKPILWHIMKIYAHYGFRRFIISLGYMGEQIKNFFLHYQAMTNDFTVRLGEPEKIRFHSANESDWEVTCVDTGLNTMTGGRVRRVRHLIDTEHFMLTYGDGVADIDLHRLFRFHRAHGKMATVTGVHPPGRFGDLILSGDQVVDFSEKRQVTEGVINGGFFVFRRQFLDAYLDDREDLILERTPMENLARDGQLMSYVHEGFWRCMDTTRDYTSLNELWAADQAAWKVWQ
jgi:glucose-1-phosphate cytidylyltransferase